MLPNAKKSSSPDAGFTLPEILITLAFFGILAAIAIPSWFSFVERQRVRSAQNSAHSAIRLAQAGSRRENLPWRVSFRTTADGRVQWTVYPVRGTPVGTLPNGVVWNDIIGEDSNKIVMNSTFRNAGGIFTTGFLFDGRVEGGVGGQGRVVFFPQGNPNNQRCVIVSTLIGSTRLDEGPLLGDGRGCIAPIPN